LVLFTPKQYEFYEHISIKIRGLFRGIFERFPGSQILKIAGFEESITSFLPGGKIFQKQAFKLRILGSNGKLPKPYR